MSSRRKFMMASGAGLLATASSSGVHASSDSHEITVGVMGLSRGLALAKDLAKLPGVRVKYLCDVDTLRLQKGLAALGGGKQQDVRGVVDFRKILEDDAVDALVCAAPNHWHAPATIMACKAGKHVYVEKPCSHSPAEGERMIQAAEQYGKCVQMGTQRRSYPGVRKAIQSLHAGLIGDVKLARCYYSNLRGSIGTGQQEQPPSSLDYELWQGPVPKREYQSNVVHYNWHWFWHWGGGELGNNGPHGLDLCRWGLDVDYPVSAVSSGSRTWFDDDQETPDTQNACLVFENGSQITWQATSCNKHQPSTFCTFFGDEGTLELSYDGTYRVFDRKDKLVDESEEASSGQKAHLLNFVTAIRENAPGLLTQPILEGHKSTLLCQLGNIAYRTGQTVVSRSTDGSPVENAEQQALWQREYADEWRKQLEI